MKEYKHLVKHVLAAGGTVSVFDGEEWASKKSADYKQIIADIESVEESQLILRDAAGNKLGWALIIPCLADDETVADYSVNEFMDAWFNTYNQ
jgi:hypothetical protein